MGYLLFVSGTIRMKCDLLRRAGPLFGFCLIASSLYSQVSFFQPPSFAGSGNLFTADFNGDGKLDLLSADGTLQLGNGDGTFTASARVSGTPVAVADFNGDGRPDVLEMGTGTLLVLLGNGDGTFQAPVTTASGAALQAIAAADLNGDGKTDVVGVFGNSLVVYLSNGDATFKPGVPYSLGAGSAESGGIISFADFNGDGKPDIAVSMAGDNVAGEEIVFLGNGDGTFQAAKTSVGIPFPNNAAVGDFNGDGKPDLVLDGPTPCTTSDCGIFFLAGNGDGTFQAPILSIANLTGTLAAADLNDDGKLDLVLEIGGVAVQTYLGNGDGTFSNANNYLLIQISGNPPPSNGGVAIADFNLDGKPDVAVEGELLIGNGDGTFRGVQAAAISNNPMVSSPYVSFAVLGKFDKRQSVPGVAVATSNFAASVYSFSVEIFTNDGKGGLSLSHSYPLDAPAVQVVTGDFNGDGNPDVLVVTTDRTTTNWGYAVLLGNGDGSFQAPVFYPQNVRSAAYAVGNSVLVSDFNNDQKMDVAVGGLFNQSLAILVGNGDGTFAPATYVFDGGDTSLVSADFNGDGNLDIAAATTMANQPATALLLGNGDGTFQAAVFPSSLSGFAPLFAADLNNDGKTDLISNRQVALGNGNGTFMLQTALPYSPIGAADFNGDGFPDLFVLYSPDTENSQTGVLTGNGDGTFSSTLLDVPRMGYIPSPVLIADMNNDGRPDIVFLSQSGFNAVGVLLNTTPANFAISATALSPSAVTSGNSASATVNLIRDFGFSGPVMLACSGLPSGASCAFTPVSVSSGSTSSSLVISTVGVAAGTYPVVVQGTSGSLVHQATLSLVIQAPPDFALTGPSATSQTISAGQSATFTLSLTPTESFSGTVSLSCAITPVATPAPTCTLSSSSVQISGTASQTPMLTVGTTAPTTTSAVQPASHGGLFPASMPLLGLLGLLFLRKRQRLSILVVLLIAATFAPWIGCGGGKGKGSPSQTTPDTPAQTYTATVTAISGNLTHTTTLQVVVQ
jgi:hypothetical protein